MRRTREKQAQTESNKVYWIALASGIGLALLASRLVWDYRWSMRWWMLDGKQDLLWGAVLKAGAGYVSVIGAVITAFKYIDERARQRLQDLRTAERELEQDRREDRKGFLIERQKVYGRLGRSLADIMNHDPGDEKDEILWPAAKEQFYKIFWGEIRLVAGKEVLELVVPFAGLLDAAKNPKDKSALSPDVTKIMDACRKELGDAWDEIHDEEKAASDENVKPTFGVRLRSLVEFR